MKCLNLILAISLFSLAQTVFAIQPNNCNDGGVYRSLVGPDVKVDRHQNKSLSIGGQELIKCQVGNTTTCVGTTYNNYTCELNFAKIDGDAGKQLESNLQFIDLGSYKGLVLTHANSDLNCGYMNCYVEDILECNNGSCAINSKLSGWDE